MGWAPLHIDLLSQHRGLIKPHCEGAGFLPLIRGALVYSPTCYRSSRGIGEIAATRWQSSSPPKSQASGDDHVLLRVGRDCRLPSPDAGRALIMRPALIDAHAAVETVRCRARAYSLYIGFYGRWPEIVAG